METVLRRELHGFGKCGHILDNGGVHAVRVCGRAHNYGSRYLADFLVCSDCWAEHTTSWSLDDVPHIGGHGNIVYGLYGGTETTGVRPCDGCGMLVERGSDPRLRYHTCSRACTVLASKRRTVTSPVTRTCPECGTVLVGRSDRRYCSDRCRQRAHRRDPEAEAAALATLRPVLAEFARFIAEH